MLDTLNAVAKLLHNLKGHNMSFEQPYSHVELIPVEFTQDQINRVILSLAIRLEHASDERTKTIMDGENMLIAMILKADKYYIWLKKLHAEM